MATLNPAALVAPQAVAGSPPGYEPPFWQRAGVLWRQLAGTFSRDGFSLRRARLQPPADLNWANSFHPASVEICLNLHGSGWVIAEGARVPTSAPYCRLLCHQRRPPEAQRLAGQHHRFLSVEFPRLPSSAGSPPTPPPSPARSAASSPRLPGRVASPRAHTPSSTATATSASRSCTRPSSPSAQRLGPERKPSNSRRRVLLLLRGGHRTARTRAQGSPPIASPARKTILLENLAELLPLEELGAPRRRSHFDLSRQFPSTETGLTLSHGPPAPASERAAELLRTRKCNVTEAALEVGYSSLSHFSQAFHEMFGCCPGLYPLRTPSQQPPPTELASDD